MLAAGESLEPRLALAANVGSFWPGTWRINGDASAGRPDDTILVERNPANLKQLRAVVNGVVVGTRPENAVARIIVDGGRGNDSIRINVPGNTRLACTLFGGPGNDTIVGGDGADTIDGGAGDDTLNGGSGNDSIQGATGDDSLVGGTGNDALSGGAGRDTLRGGAGRNSLDGGQGTDAFYGVAGVDRVRLDPGERLFGNESTNPLKQIDDLTKLEAWFIDTAMAQWGDQLGKEAGYWWGLTARTYDSAPLAATTTTAGASGGDFTGTNNQTAGVDEADHVKTDGEHLYVIAGDGVDILDVSAAGALAAVSHVTTPGEERALFLSGTRLTVISQESRWEPLVDDGSTTVGRFANWWNYRWQSQVCVTVVDVSAAGQPTILETTRLDGWFVDGRAIDDRVIVVTQDSFSIPSPAIIAIPPTTPPDAGGEGAATPGSSEAAPAVTTLPAAVDLAVARILPPVDGDGSRYVYEDAAAYRARLERAWDQTAIPGYTVTVAAGSSSGDLAVPGRTYLPVTPSDDSLLSVVSFDVGDAVPGPDSTTAVAGVSGQVYASASSLYIWGTNYGNWWDSLDQTWTTNIYKFDLGGEAVPLVALGAVPGMAINQFAFDETAAGLLRVATTAGWGDAASSGVFVLAVAAGGNLRTVGSVTGLAPGERIYSVRFIGDRGYVSTFRQVDPLFVIDLSRPTAPRVVGQLKIPGFSSYLHPLDAGRLLGIGRDVDPVTGQVLGLQLSIFDVTNPAKPLRTATYTFPGTGWSSWSAALWDHHAIGWFAKQGILAIPVQEGGWWEGGSNGLVVFKVDPAKGANAFTNLGRIDHVDDVTRSVRVGEYLYSVSWGEVRVHRIDDPTTEIGRVPLAPREFTGPIWAI